MKRLILVVLALVLMACASTGPPDDRLTKVAIEAAAVMAGNHLGKAHPELIAPALRFSASLNAGEVTAAQINDGLATLAGLDVDPLIIEEILLLAGAAGAEIDLEDGKILGLVNVSDRYLKTAMDGFFRGMRLACPTCEG